jgi:hypothetical protein
MISEQSFANPAGCLWSSSPLASLLIKANSENSPADSMDHLQFQGKCAHNSRQALF